MDNNKVNFPQGYQVETQTDYLWNGVTPQGMIPSLDSDMATENTQLAKHKQQELNETIYRGVGSAIDSSMTTAEILNRAGLNWQVSKILSYFQDSDGNFVAHDKWYGIMRNDTQQILSAGNLASEGWKIYQNEQVVNTFREFCDKGKLELERVGSLKGGQIVFATALVNDEFELPGNDRISGKLILTN